MDVDIPQAELGSGALGDRDMTPILGQDHSLALVRSLNHYYLVGDVVLQVSSLFKLK